MDKNLGSDARRYAALAGFESDWLFDLDQRWCRDMREAIASGTFRFAGGLSMYLAAGRKP